MGGTFDQKEERIRELEYRRMEISVSEEQKEKRLKKNEQSLKKSLELWNTNRFNQHIQRRTLRKSQCREDTRERTFEKIMAENYPNLIKDVNINMAKSQCTLR